MIAPAATLSLVLLWSAGDVTWRHATTIVLRAGGHQAPAAAASPADESAEGPSPAELRRRVLQSEDGRDPSPAGIAPILEALRSKDTETRRVAVRALGRFERQALVAIIAPALADPAPNVRAEAANALAQAAAAGGDSKFVLDLLLGQLEREAHPFVRGILAASLGRLRHPNVEQMRQAERAIVATAKTPATAAEVGGGGRDVPAERAQFAPPLTLLGTLRGLEALARLHGSTWPLDPSTIAALRDLASVWRSAVARAEGGPTAEAAARLRRLAMAALVSARATDPVTISTAFGDADDQVRRLAAEAAAAADPVDTKFVDRAIRDRAGTVRTAIVASLGRREYTGTCGYAGLLLRDPDPSVAISAIDVASRACTGVAAAVAPLVAVVNQLPPPPLSDVDAARAATAVPEGPRAFGLTAPRARAGVWQPAAHALVAVARLAPDQARGPIEKLAGDPRWLVRLYAARAAGVARLEEVLRRLAGDEHDNVRSEAIAGLRSTAPRASDDLFLAALGRGDDQLLIAAAEALQGTGRREEAAQALLDALDRVTAGKRESSRDVRRALLDRLEDVGSHDAESRLSPYLRDFDPVVAERAAAIVSKWTGRIATAHPQPLPRPPLPGPADLDALGAARLAVRVRDVGRFEIRLLPQEAPLNAWRFYRLARENYFDGLTVHRVVPNFVVQGGSPRANEFAGAAALTRDELGLQTNVRGTLGVSTRGRDTGDGQFFINLVDNVRLDHEYTVFGQIERGVEVLDAVLEGDVIEDVEVGAAR
jgi:cyclophilin family peptidyl-prolyl cis-trans isomerase/HEAT repeat protein